MSLTYLSGDSSIFSYVFVILALGLLLWLNSKVWGPSLICLQFLWQEGRMGERGAWIVYEKAKLGMKTDVVTQLVSRGMWGVVMVLVGYRSNDSRLMVIASIIIRVYYLQCISFLSLSNKRSVTVSTVSPVHTSGKQGKIKKVLLLTILSRSLGPWRT